MLVSFNSLGGGYQPLFSILLCVIQGFMCNTQVVSRLHQLMLGCTWTSRPKGLCVSTWPHGVTVEFSHDYCMVKLEVRAGRFED